MEIRMTAIPDYLTVSVALMNTLFANAKSLDDYKAPFTRPLTLTEKILSTHLTAPLPVKPVGGVTEVSLKPDRVILPDSSGQMVWLQFMSTGIDSVKVPTTTHCDHLIEATVNGPLDLRSANIENHEVYDFLRFATTKHGGDFWDAGSGIIHQVVLERYGFPGGLIIGADSHTPNAGGLGMLAIGVGGADAVEVMAGMPWSMIWPKTIGVHLKGELHDWATPKDIILYLTDLLGVAGATGCVIEYFGDGINNLSATGRATICNMGAELGATSSIFPYDSRTEDFLIATHRTEYLNSITTYRDYLVADPEVLEDPEQIFDQFILIDLNKLPPQVNGPFSPDRGNSISDFSTQVGQHSWPDTVSAAFIGSCTNSSYEDISGAASIARQARQRGLVAKCPLYISPGSQNILETVIRDGLIDDLVAIGATVLASACGPCIGLWNRVDSLSDLDNSIVTSFNRNFPGRNDGSLKTHAFLMSTEMVIAKALSGRLAFNPEFDTLTDPSGKDFYLTSPDRISIPTNGFCLEDSGYEAAYSGTTLGRTMTSLENDRIQRIIPFDKWDGKDLDNLLLLCQTSGKCTTDQISPAGKWMKYRGNLDALSDNLLLGATNAHCSQVGHGINQLTGSLGTLAEIAKYYSSVNRSWIIVGDHNMGEGSSREHASLEPRYLGCRAVIARSFSRIFESNLKRHGILAVTFSDPDDYKRFLPDDLVSIVGIKSLQPHRPLSVHLNHSDSAAEEFEVLHSFTDEQIAWFHSGSSLNYLSSQFATTLDKTTFST
jgi:aconitate hydratase